MGKFNKEVLVIDVESTCWESLESKPENEESEIIEIGITGVDISKPVITFNESIIVKPKKSKISNFCTKLTTLYQKDVDRGVNYFDACEVLEKEYKSRKKMMVSWGDYDRNMFKQSDDHRYPFGNRHLNLKATFSLFYGLNKEIGMAQALKYIGIKLEGTHHRGGDDSKNIAKILIHMLEKFRIQLS